MAFDDRSEGAAVEAHRAVRAPRCARTRSRCDKKLIFPRKNFEASRQSWGCLACSFRRNWAAWARTTPARRWRWRRSPATAAHRPPCATPCILGAVAAALLRASRQSDTAEHHEAAWTRKCWSAPCPIPIRRPARISGIRCRPGPRKRDDGWKVRKKASWTTSGGFADWYIIQTTSPDFGGNYSDLSCLLIMGDEVKADPSKWDGLGLRGNQSGTDGSERDHTGRSHGRDRKVMAPIPTTKRSIPSSCSVPRPAGTASRWV